MKHYVQILDGLDVAKLQAEADLLAEYYHNYYKDIWRGIALCAPPGLSDQDGVRFSKSLVLPYFQDIKECSYTRYMKMLEYIPSILEGLGVKIHLVRMLKVKAHSQIREHTDMSFFNFEKGTYIRLHIPIYTSSEVKFMLGGEPCYLEAGKLYATDVSRRHNVINDSDQNRVHIVADIKVTGEERRAFLNL